MKGSVGASSKEWTIQDSENTPFDKDFVAKSRYVLIAMAIASLYCIGYGIILYHEFSKMGILEAFTQML